MMRRSAGILRKSSALLALSSTICLLGCAARRIANDYIFGVTGIVTTEDEAPLQGADVTLDVNGPVYEGIDLVRTKHLLTNSTGGFVFEYISHRRGVNYTITVSKEGFEPGTVSGAAPPDGSHAIRLKKSAKPDKTGQ
jgi:hypothetical protein